MPRGIPLKGYRKMKRDARGPEIERAVEIACKRVSKDALEFLEQAIKDSELDPRVRMMAAKEILDRAWGKPKQNIEQSVNVNAGEDLLQALRDARNRAQQDSITAEFSTIPIEDKRETLQ